MEVVLIVLLVIDALMLLGVILYQIFAKPEDKENEKSVPQKIYADRKPEEPEEAPAPIKIINEAQEETPEPAESIGEEQEDTPVEEIEETVEEEAEETEEEPEFVAVPAEEKVKTVIVEDVKTEEIETVEIIVKDEEYDDEEEDEDDDEYDEVEGEPEINAAATEEAVDPLFTSLAIKRKPAVPFYTKMLNAEEHIQDYYNQIRNEFKSYKGINARISKRCDTFRKGRELIAKLMLSGKGRTIKIYFKLDPEAYEVNKFHQKNAGDKKSYAEIPMLIRVKGDRGFANALKLINELMEKENVVKKQRYVPINYIETLKGLEENK